MQTIIGAANSIEIINQMTYTPTQHPIKTL